MTFPKNVNRYYAHTVLSLSPPRRESEVKAMKRAGTDEAKELCDKCFREISGLTHTRYSTTWELVYEAGRAHRNEAYVAAATTCRCALEAVLEEAFAWEIRENRLYLRQMLKYCRPGLEQLIQWSKDVSLLTQDQPAIAHEIQREGNFAAHLRQKIDEELGKYLLKGKAPDQPYRLWMSKEKSLDLLKKTVDLVTGIVRKAMEIEEKSNYPHTYRCGDASTVV